VPLPALCLEKRILYGTKNQKSIESDPIDFFSYCFDPFIVLSVVLVTGFGPRSKDTTLTSCSKKSNPLLYLDGSNADKAANTKTSPAILKAIPVITLISPNTSGIELVTKAAPLETPKYWSAQNITPNKTIDFIT
jgi:hypothetical protein